MLGFGDIQCQHMNFASVAGKLGGDFFAVKVSGRWAISSAPLIVL